MKVLKLEFHFFSCCLFNDALSSLNDLTSNDLYIKNWKYVDRSDLGLFWMLSRNLTWIFNEKKWKNFSKDRDIWLLYLIFMEQQCYQHDLDFRWISFFNPELI